MMKKLVKIIASLVAVITVLGCAFTCSAAVVTNGSEFYDLGDANMDGVVDIRDLIRMKKYIVETDKTALFVSDIDGDGSVASTDLTLLRKYFMEGIDVLEPDNSIWNSEIK